MTLSSSEEAAAPFWVSRGHHVRAVRPVNEQEVKTGDLHVDGVGRVEVYSPQPTTSTDTMVRKIITKSRQASFLHVEVVSTNATEQKLRRVDKRVFEHPRRAARYNDSSCAATGVDLRHGEVVGPVPNLLCPRGHVVNISPIPAPGEHAYFDMLNWDAIIQTLVTSLTDKVLESKDREELTEA